MDYVERLREHTAPLGRLRARYGVFFVTGTHEYYSGAGAWIEEMRRLGMTFDHEARLRDGDDEFDATIYAITRAAWQP